LIAVTLILTISLTAARAADPDRPYNFSRPTGVKSRISGPLRELVRVQAAARQARSPMPPIPAESHIVVDSAERVRVMISARDIAALRPALAQLGFRELAASPQHFLVEGYLPIDQLDAAAALVPGGILGIRPSLRPITRVGSVTSEADVVLQTNRVRAALPVGYDGSGVKIGVLSDSYNALGGAAAGVASGDLPTGLQVLDEIDFLGDGTDEGRAMVELIHDCAPGSPIAFASAFNGELEFALNIVALFNAGCRVICDDVGYLDEPYFQDGIISQSVTQVTNSGAVYFAAAGNQASLSYESAAYAETSIAAPVDGYTDQWFDFDPTSGADATQRITMRRGQYLLLAFQYDNPFYTTTGVTTDLDLYLVDPATGQAVASGADDNIQFQTPVEYLEFYNDDFVSPTHTYDIMIHRFAGPQITRVKYIHYGSTVTTNEYDTHSSTVSGHGGGDGGNAVAAAPYFGHSAPESFTSAGPRTIVFNPAGQRLPTPVVRQTPEITSIDGTNTTFFYSDFEGDGIPNFFGTSAAAPHAAAVAALVRQANPGFTPAQVYQRMQTTADASISTPGFDNLTGNGLINAWAAVFGPAVPASIPFSDGFESGFLSSAWDALSNVAGRILVTSQNGPANGTRHVTLDTFVGFSNPDTSSLNELILHLNALGATNVTLAFKQREYSDDDNAMPVQFTGSQNVDGVAFSVDGNTWYQIVSLTGGNSLNAYQSRIVDLSALAASKNVVLSADTRIKFQQYDNTPIPNDGFAFDDITVTNQSSPPLIITQPVSIFRCDGEQAVFSVSAIGAAPLTYRWKKNTVDLNDGGNIAGATTATLTLSSVTPADAATYSVVVTNPNGPLASSDATLGITAAPSVALASTSELRCIGQSITLAPTISGPPPFTYQWKKNGVDISGATNPTLTLSDLLSLDAGAYSLVVGNPCRTIESDPINLTVAPPIACNPILGFEGCPSDQTVVATSPAGALVYFFPPQVSPPSDRVALSSTHAPATVFPVGETTVTFTATDLQTADVQSCSFKVTVTTTLGPNGQPSYPTIANPSSGATTGAAGQASTPVANSTCFTVGLVDGLLLAATPAALAFISRRRPPRRRA